MWFRSWCRAVKRPMVSRCLFCGQYAADEGSFRYLLGIGLGDELLDRKSEIFLSVGAREMIVVRK
jgi:hypothetical protein